LTLSFIDLPVLFSGTEGNFVGVFWNEPFQIFIIINTFFIC